jgi:hypothetical protein
MCFGFACVCVCVCVCVCLRQTEKQLQYLFLFLQSLYFMFGKLVTLANIYKYYQHNFVINGFVITLKANYARKEGRRALSTQA